MAKPRIAIVGEFQTGKSTLVNLLFARDVAQVGDGLPCTALATRYHFQQAEVVRIGGDSYEIGAWINSGDVHKDETVVEVGVNNALLLGFDLVDTPGVEAAGKLGEQHEAITFAQVETSDAFILLLDKLPEGGSDTGMGRLITKLGASAKPTFGFFNCGRLGTTKHPKSQASTEIVDAIKARLKEAGLPIPFIADNLKGGYDRFSEESTRFSILHQIEKCLMQTLTDQLCGFKKEMTEHTNLLQNRIRALKTAFDQQVANQDAQFNRIQKAFLTLMETRNPGKDVRVFLSMLNSSKYDGDGLWPCPYCGEKTEGQTTDNRSCRHCNKTFRVKCKCPSCRAEEGFNKWGPTTCDKCGFEYDSWMNSKISKIR